jgi:flap endonuclease-1
MGIKQLTSLIRSKSPNSIQTVGLYTYKDKTLAIDTSIFVYRSLTNVRHNGEYLRNHEGKVVSHIVGLFHKTVQYLSLGITPLYILDGKPPEEKFTCIQERNQRAQESRVKLAQTNDPAEKTLLEKASIRINKSHIDDLKHLFHLMGVGYIQSESEAESYAGELCRIGYVDAVVSEDMDTLLYGPTTLIRHCLDRTVKRKDAVSTFNLEQILQDFQMTHEQFTDVCILCGCDYCGTIPTIGPQRAFQNIQTYGSIEGLIASGKYTIPEEFLANYPRARELFHIFRKKVDVPTIPLVSSNIQYDDLQTYLVQECAMDDTRVKNSLSKLKRGQTTYMTYNDIPNVLD